jgi:Raf kinase inhibitor-like YbhB/YbcL family protein
MRLTSEAFPDHGEIPRHFTPDGEDISPPLRWSEAPKAAKSFVVIVDDPDAPNGPFHHWACYDIPAYHTGVVEGSGRPGSFEDFRHAVNDFDELGYIGPRPPHGDKAHHYRFRLLALDCPELQIRTHPSCAEVEREARKHLLAEASLVGLYAR